MSRALKGINTRWCASGRSKRLLERAATGPLPAISEPALNRGARPFARLDCGESALFLVPVPGRLRFSATRVSRRSVRCLSSATSIRALRPRVNSPAPRPRSPYAPLRRRPTPWRSRAGRAQPISAAALWWRCAYTIERLVHRAILRGSWRGCASAARAAGGVAGDAAAEGGRRRRGPVLGLLFQAFNGKWRGESLCRELTAALPRRRVFNVRTSVSEKRAFKGPVSRTIPLARPVFIEPGCTEFVLRTLRSE